MLNQSYALHVYLYNPNRRAQLHLFTPDNAC